MRILTRAEARRLLNQPNVECATGRRNRAILELLYRSGARTGEIVNLRAEDVHLEGPDPTVLLAAGQGRPQERDLPLDDESVRVLRQYARKRRRAEFFFTTLEGGQVSPDYIRQMVARCAQKAGLDPGEVSPRSLRDTYAAELEEEPQFTPEDMQIALGLGSRASLDRYLHGRSRSLRDKIQRRPEQGSLRENPDPEILRIARELADMPPEKRLALGALLADRQEE